MIAEEKIGLDRPYDEIGNDDDGNLNPRFQVYSWDGRLRARVTHLLLVFIKEENFSPINPTIRFKSNRTYLLQTFQKSSLPSTMFGRTKNTSTRHGAGVATSLHPKKSHQLIQHILRLLQFLSATTSLILFSIRLAKILRLVHKASRSNGAVEGIVAAAVLYTLIVMALSFGVKAGGGNMLRILLIVFDLLFAGAFIAVAVLTSPKRHGSSGPCTGNRNANDFVSRFGRNNVNCRLPWGTFILAIFST